MLRKCIFQLCSWCFVQFNKPQALSSKAGWVMTSMVVVVVVVMMMSSAWNCLLQCKCINYEGYAWTLSCKVTSCHPLCGLYVSSFYDIYTYICACVCIYIKILKIWTSLSETSVWPGTCDVSTNNFSFVMVFNLYVFFTVTYVHLFIAGRAPRQWNSADVLWWS